MVQSKLKGDCHSSCDPGCNHFWGTDVNVASLLRHFPRICVFIHDYKYTVREGRNNMALKTEYPKIPVSTSPPLFLMSVSQCDQFQSKCPTARDTLLFQEARHQASTLQCPLPLSNHQPGFSQNDPPTHTNTHNSSIKYHSATASPRPERVHWVSHFSLQISLCEGRKFWTEFVRLLSYLLFFNSLDTILFCVYKCNTMNVFLERLDVWAIISIFKWLSHAPTSLQINIFLWLGNYQCQYIPLLMK